MGVKVTTPPAAPFTIAELRLHLRVDTISGTHPEDALMLAYALAAHGFAEFYTERAIGSQTRELALDAFPAAAIELPGGPVTGITSITYVDEAGDTQTLASNLYTLDDYGTPCWAVPAVDTYWPATLATANAVKVVYVVGDLPDAVKSALLLIVGHLYERRADSANVKVEEIPLGACALLDTVKIWSY